MQKTYSMKYEAVLCQTLRLTPSTYCNHSPSLFPAFTPRRSLNLHMRACTPKKSFLPNGCRSVRKPRALRVGSLACWLARETVQRVNVANVRGVPEGKLVLY